MKNFKVKWLLLSFILSIASINTVWGTARTYDGTEKIYVKNVQFDGWDPWICSGTYGWVHLWGGSTGEKNVKLELVSGTANTAGAIYACTPPAGNYTTLILARSTSSSSINYTNGQSKNISIPTDATKNYIKYWSPSNYGEDYINWDKYAPVRAVCGAMNSWNTMTNQFSNGKLTINLSKGDYEFKLVDGEQWSGSGGTVNGTQTNHNITVGGGDNITLKITTAGNYDFYWSENKSKLAVIFPSDQDKVNLVKNKVIYFDSRAGDKNVWNQASYTSRFAFKTCVEDSIGFTEATTSSGFIAADSVFYVQVPKDNVGRIRMMRMNPSSSGSCWNMSSYVEAVSRTTSSQNCLIKSNDNLNWWNTWTPEWTTYCPPMSTSTLTDNGTVKTWGGNGSSGSPYLIPTSSSIKVSASSSSTVTDDNMTAYYLFKYNSVAQGSGSSTNTKTITASNISGNNFPVIVESYNYYNSTEGARLASNAIYYETRTPYTISYNAGTGGGGSRANETKLKGVSFTLPNSAVFTRTGYTQTGWTTSDGGSQTHTLGGSYTGDVAQTFYPVWTANEYTITLDKGDGTGEYTTSVTATYNSSSLSSSITKPTYPVGKRLVAWATAKGAWVISDNGVLRNNVSDADGTYTDASGNWIYDGNVTLTAVYQERWVLQGVWEGHDYGFGTSGWSSTDTKFTSISDGVGTYTIDTLRGNVWYKFGVRDLETDKWYVYSSANITGTATNTVSETSGQTTMNTKGAGRYSFALNFSTMALTVTYPTSYTATYGSSVGGSISGTYTGYKGTPHPEDESITSGNYYPSGAELNFWRTAPNAGYSFKGWFDNVEGTGDALGDEVEDKQFQIASLSGSVTVYAVYEPVILTFNATTDATWNTASNWSPACVPTIKHDVIIDKPVVVNITDAVAKSVKIYNDSTSSHAGKLTIGAGKALVVAEDIKKTKDGSTKIATTADVLHIEAGSTSVGNGALVWGTSGTPGVAQVDFFTKSHGVKDQNTSINQYIGTPFSNDQSILYQYYYSWLFKITRTAGVLSWDLMAGDESMNEFEGYNLITAYDANTTYQMEGTLVSNANVTLSASSATGLPKLVYSGSDGADNPNNENVLANSWVAPIKINALNGFSNVEGSIYIFNAGSEKQAETAATGTAGNYTTYTIGSAGDSDVIPSMQSFSVYATGSSPSITLNYNTIVYTPVSGGLVNTANKAPARDRADEMQLLKVRIDGENGWADELKIYIHEDFSNAFEDSWDAHKMYGYPEAPQLYAVTTDGNMAINCVPTADNNVLGFTPGSEDNEYTFSFTYDGDEEYYLKDTKLNIETLINTEATYTFTSEAEDSDMRFIIIKRAPAVATDVETVSGDRLAVSGVQKIMHNGQLYIIREGNIYSTDGQMVK